MKLVTINVGDVQYAKYSLPFIEKICEFNNIEFVCLTKNLPQNHYNLHPSWLKLFLHDLFDDEFIISWDLDLVPCKLYNLKQYFDITKLNFVCDSSYLYDNHSFNGKFKYNCGLIGIPKSYSYDLKAIYSSNGHNSSYPSYEQYHVNDWIHDNYIEVNTMPEKLNCMKRNDRDFPEDVLNKHYTYMVPNIETKIALIKQHYNLYKDIL